MEIYETGNLSDSATSAFDVKAFQNGQWTAESMRLAKEFSCKLRLNGVSLTCLTCSPQDVTDLCIGWLISTGAVPKIEDIISVHLDWSSGQCEVTADKTSVLRIELPIIREAASWHPEWAAPLDCALGQDTPLYQETGSFHSCILMQDGKILCVREDIGRHNALDKAIGWAVQRGVRLEKCIAFSSARLPADLVRKAIQSGITVLASKSLPTIESAELAKAHGLTLLHYSERRGLLQFV